MEPKMVEESREILGKKKWRVHSEMVAYAGAKHGLAVRGDPGSERERWSKRGRRRIRQ